eukprot:3407957-Pleurochrysis_carterae.AAC.7
MSRIRRLQQLLLKLLDLLVRACLVRLVGCDHERRAAVERVADRLSRRVLRAASAGSKRAAPLHLKGALVESSVVGKRPCREAQERRASGGEKRCTLAVRRRVLCARLDARLDRDDQEDQVGGGGAALQRRDARRVRKRNTWHSVCTWTHRVRIRRLARVRRGRAGKASLGARQAPRKTGCKRRRRRGESEANTARARRR